MNGHKVYSCLHKSLIFNQYLRMLHEIRPTRIPNWKSRFLKLIFKFYSRRILTPYSIWYLTLNITRFTSYFWIVIPGQVIRRSLVHVHKVKSSPLGQFLNALPQGLHDIEWLFSPPTQPNPLLKFFQ